MARLFKANGQRLVQQLAVAAILPVLVLGIVVSLVTVYALRQISLNLILQRNTALVQVAAGGMANTLNGYLEALHSAGSALGDFESTPATQESALRNWAPLLHVFEGGLALLDHNGVAVATTPDHRERMGLDYSFRDYYHLVRTQQVPVFSPVLREMPSGEEAIVIAAPILRAGEFAGALLGVVFLQSDAWAKDLEPLRTQPDNQIYLIDSTGTIIYHPDATRIGRRIREEQVLGQLASSGLPSSRLYRSASLNRQVVVSYSPLPGIGWGLMMEEPWDAVLAPTLPFIWTVITLLSLGAVLSLTVLLTGINAVTSPLSALAGEAEQVSMGAAFRPLEIEGPREVRTLIRVFNQMVSRLAEQQTALRHYAIQMLQSQEEERKRLSRELHDESIQQLVGLVQRIELCRSEVARDPAAAGRRLDELQSLAKAAASDLRRMSNDLRPPILEDLGLPAAIQTQCDELARATPESRVHCEIVGSERRLDPEIELTVFRVVQEAMNNVRKHARTARQVNVTLYFEDGEIVAVVEDDGPGFEYHGLVSPIHDGHLGLAGMFERAHLLAGEIGIDAVPGKGTTIMLRLPSGSANLRSQDHPQA